jgi:hypothetical protein
MAALPPIPPGNHAHAGNDAMCEPRERASAIIAIVFAFLLGITLFVTAFLQSRPPSAQLVANAPMSRIVAGSPTTPSNPDGAPSHPEAPLQVHADPPATAPTAVPPSVPADPLPPDEPVDSGDPSTGSPEPSFGFSLPEPDPSVQPLAPTTRFLGIATTGNRVAFVVDASVSMSIDQRFSHARLELKRSIEELASDKYFSVIFFTTEGDDPHVRKVLPPGDMQLASRSNKQTAIRWIDSVRLPEPIGPDLSIPPAAEPAPALVAAVKMKSDAIFLLTDGEPAVIFDDQLRPVLNDDGSLATSQAWIEDVLPELELAGATGRVSVNTIAFYTRASEEILKRIAARFNGSYRFVPQVGKRP